MADPYDPTKKLPNEAQPLTPQLQTAQGPGLTAQPNSPPPPAAPTQPPPPVQPPPNPEQAAGIKDAGIPGFVILPNGAMVDRNHPLYTQALAAAPSQPVAAPTAPTAAPAPGAPPGPQNAQQALTTAPQATPQTPAAAFQQALMNKLQGPPVDRNNPEIAGALAANRLAEQRGMERNRGLLAERAAAQGLDASGGFETGLLGLAQDRAGREAAFEGQAVQNLGNRQAQEIMQALSLTGGLLGQQDQLGLGREELALRDKLAQLQATISREGLAQQGQLGNRDIDLRGELGRGQLNLGLLGLLQGGQNASNALGLQAGLGQAQLNQQALMSLLNGL